MGRWLAWLGAIACFAAPGRGARAGRAVAAASDPRQRRHARRRSTCPGPGPGRSIPIATGSAAFTASRRARAIAAGTIATPRRWRGRIRGALFEYDMRHSPTALLPSSWITQDPTLRYYDRLVWYQRAFTVRRRAGRARLPALRRGRLCRLCLSQRPFRRAARGRLHALRVRGDRAAARRREPDHDRRRCRARRRDGAADGDRLGDLWRHHPPGPADPDAREPMSTTPGCASPATAASPRPSGSTARTRPAAPVRRRDRGAPFRA